MEIKLNLLPKDKEKKIRNKKLLKFLILQEVLIIFLTILFFGVIKGVNAIAILQTNSIEKELSSKGEKNDYIEIKKYENGLKEAKNEIDFIKKIQSRDIDWLAVLEKFPQLVPKDILFLSMEAQGYDLTIKGQSKDRDTLIEMKQNLEKDNCFNDVNIPLNDIVLRNNIDFEIKFNIDEKCLINYEK